MNYPEMLKQYRAKMFLSQNNLAKKIGVSVVTVNRWENGHFEPTIRCKRELNKLFKKAKMVEE